MPESQDVIGRVREALTRKNEELFWGASPWPSWAQQLSCFLPQRHSPSH